MDTPTRRIIGIVSVCLLVLGTSCNLVTTFLRPAATSTQPQAGKWSANISYPGSGGNTIHWILNFTVSDDGKQLDHIQAFHYLGEISPSTQVSFMMAMQPEDVKNNTFSVSFSEISSNYSSTNYKFEGTFTSATQAAGTLKTPSSTYQFTAAPATP